VSEVWVVPVVAVALVQVAVIATSVYLHRALAHRALVVHPVADVLFRTVLWLTTGQRRQEWVAVHRKHHAFTDQEGDPHSPQLLGFWRVQLLNVYYYMREARNRGTIEINPRDAMGKAASIIGMILMNITPDEAQRAGAALSAGLENGTLSPIVGREFPLSEAPRAHEAVLAPGAHGKIVLIP